MNSLTPSLLIARVLVVEDEPMLRSAVVTGLSRLRSVEVVGAGSVAAALAEIAVRPPAVVISDIDLPDRSGIELLGELGARGLKPHVVFMSAYVKAYRAQIPPNAGVEVLEKPVSLETLRSLVEQHIHTTADASPFGVPDYLQLASLGHHSVLLEIATANTTGRIVVVSGEAWGAEDAQGSGMEAFRRLAMATDSIVRCQTLITDPGQRTLTGSAESLLLECARLADEASARPPKKHEAKAGDAPAPAQSDQSTTFAELSLDLAPEGVDAAVMAPDGETFEQWFERGVEASLKRQHQVALDAFRKAYELRSSDAKTRANIARLEALLSLKQ